MTSLRRLATVTVMLAVLVVATVSALAFTATPASAYSSWNHQGTLDPNDPSVVIPCGTCHGQGTPTDATCTSCHPGFTSFPGDNCWSCHLPGQSTKSLSTPSSACTQECHLWNSAQKSYSIPFTHGTNPHLGSTPECLDCHTTSQSAFDPGASPHHSGQATGFTQCSACHSSQQKHAGKVACTSCHTSAQQFHLYQASSPGFKNCGSCHTMKHAGKKVPQSKCAQCHKGTSGRAPQHSKSVSKKFVCSGCHKQKLHARSVSKAVKNCRTCHGGKYHARQRTPSRTVCTKCHSRALRHANGYQCTLCHRKAVHRTRPSAIN